MNEEAFHKSRRMFVQLEGSFWLAKPEDTRSHEEWFQENFKDYDESWLFKYVRGFFDNSGVYLYIQTKGSKWDVTPQVLIAAPAIVWHLHFMTLEPDLKLQLPRGLPVYGGMVPTIPGVRWAPKCNLGLTTGSITEPPKQRHLVSVT